MRDDIYHFPDPWNLAPDPLSYYRYRPSFKELLASVEFGFYNVGVYAVGHQLAFVHTIPAGYHIGCGKYFLVLAGVDVHFKTNNAAAFGCEILINTIAIGGEWVGDKQR